jgi:hypothetical protein
VLVIHELQMCKSLQIAYILHMHTSSTCSLTHHFSLVSCVLLQLLLVMWVLEHASVNLLLCWLLVVPLLLGVTRAAHVAKSSWLQPLQASQLPWLAAAAAGLGEANVQRHPAHP